MSLPRPTNLRHNDESRSSRNEDHNTQFITRSRTEEEKKRRREEWRREQKLRERHEKLKERKILDYEKKRAQALQSAQKFTHNRSRSSSKSPSYYESRRRSIASRSDILFKKLDGPTREAVPLFKGPKGTQISATELRRIKVDIRRNLPIKGPVIELQRDILNFEDVVLKRREGEGCKPIFEREEIKKAVVKTDEVEERRVVAINDERSVLSDKSQSTKKRSSSLSPNKKHCYSPTYLPSSNQIRYHTRSEHRDNRTEYREHRRSNGRNSVEKRRDYKEKYAERDARKYGSNHSRSRERDSRNSKSFVEERSYRDRYRNRSSERSRERRNRDRDGDRDRDRDRSRERRDVAPHYIEPVPVPIYCNFPPRPIVVSPMGPFRGQIPPIGRGRYPALMPPVRPFPPRLVPPDIYRMGPPNPNSKYGPMY